MITPAGEVRFLKISWGDISDRCGDVAQRVSFPCLSLRDVAPMAKAEI